MSFQADVRQAEGTVVLDMAGDLNGLAEETLTDAHARAVAGGPRVVVLDFADVDYINSTGIALIVRILTEARDGGREVRAAGLTSHYRHIFEITRLADFMTFHPDESAAVAGTAPAGA